MSDREIEELWKTFSNVCIDEEECIDIDFYIWNKGAFREDIWKWFDKKHSKGVYYLMHEMK